MDGRLNLPNGAVQKMLDGNTYIGLLSNAYILFPIFAFAFIYYESNTGINLFLLILAVISSCMMLGIALSKSESIIRQKKRITFKSTYKSLRSPFTLAVVFFQGVLIFIGLYILAINYLNILVGLLIFLYGIGSEAFSIARGFSQKNNGIIDITLEESKNISKALGLAKRKQPSNSTKKA